MNSIRVPLTNWRSRWPSLIRGSRPAGEDASFRGATGRRHVRRVLPILAILVAAAFSPPSRSEPLPADRPYDAPVQTRAEVRSLLEAARSGDVIGFRAVLKSGVSFNARNVAGDNALILAVQSGREDMLAEVLAHKPDLDERGALGMTALGIAVTHDAPLIVAALLRAGADPNVADAAGATPLASALRLQRPDLAHRLLAAGADPRRADRDRVTPLHIAAELGQTELAGELLRAGADPNVLDAETRSPIFLALLHRHPEVAEILVRRRRTNLNLVTQGYPTVYWAHQLGYADLEKLIRVRLAKG